MNQKKIGQFIAENRKKQKMTQAELAEKLGVSDRSVSKWETGRCMPDLSLFEPLCEQLGITINELLSGEKIKTEEYQNELEKNIINTIDYSQKQIEDEKWKRSYVVMIIGILFCMSAFIVFEAESSWSSMYSLIGTMIFVSGLYHALKIKNKGKKLGISVLAFFLILSLFYVVDYISVTSFHRPPIYRYMTSTNWQSDAKIITYHSFFYDVYRINADTPNEYYIVDTGKTYRSSPLPIMPFQMEKSGIAHIIRYQAPYIGDNTNIGNLLSCLPLSEFGYVFEIDDVDHGLIVDYHTTDWYANENQYVDKALLYNAVSLFLLIDNLESVTFHFSGGSYQTNRAVIENAYPSYFEILTEEQIDKAKFHEYVENKMNDTDFVERVFAKCFTQHANEISSFVKRPYVKKLL